MKTIAASTVLALSATTFAQTTAAPEAAPTAAAIDSANAAKDDLKFMVAGGYAHFFDTDFDSGGGGVAVNRGFGAVSMRGAPKDTYEWGVSVSWEGSWYSFQSGGTLAAAAGGKPWGAIQSVNVVPSATFKFGDQWRVNAALLVGFAGENDADAWDSATFGGIVAASYAFSKDFVLGAGVLAATRIEDDVLVIPQIIIDWKPCKEFRLTNMAGPEAYPGGAGLEAIWVLSDEYEVALGGRYTYRRFRLDDDGAPARAGGVGTDEGLPIWLRATMRAKCGARLDLIAGIQVGSEMQLDDAAGNEIASVDVEPNPFLGIFASWRF